MSPRKAAAPKPTSKPKPAPKRASTMSDQHKAALAAGREQGRAVRTYLAALDQNKPRRGRKRTTDTVARQLSRTESELATATGVGRLELLQRRRDLQAELQELDGDNGVDLSALKDGFVRCGREYAARKGIDYQTFREFGVPPSVLKEAGISRGRA